LVSWLSDTGGRQVEFTAEYAEYTENKLPAGSASAYFAYSAVCLSPEHSPLPANIIGYCGIDSEG
jgi:hypothetical protein